MTTTSGQPKKMRFLVPMDFSSNARNAGRYAASLAEATGASVLFLHVIAPTLDEGTSLTIDIPTIKKEAKRMLVKWTDSIRRQYSIACDERIRTGGVIDEILNLAGKEKCDYIIMGTHGNNIIRRLVFGSTTTAVIEISPYPVLAVPEAAGFSPYEHLVFATDYQSSDVEDLKQLAKLASLFKARIDVVHVMDEHDSGATELSILEYFEELAKKHIPYSNISYRILTNESVTRGIELFVQSVGGNLVALSTHKLGFLGKLFHASHAKEFASRTRVPLMVFHVRESGSESDI